MGDGAAVDLMKVLSSKTEITAADANAALDIVHMAFEKPDSIIESMNRKPSATLLLQQLSTSTGSDTTKSRVGQRDCIPEISVHKDEARTEIARDLCWERAMLARSLCLMTQPFHF